MNRTNIFKALANFQQEVPVIHKDTQGYGYVFADLPKVFDVINPFLKKHGLGFTQLMQGQNIHTIVFHIESGETLESTTEIPQNVVLKGMNEFQVLGSAITYIRRYALSSLLGLVTDKDNDGAGDKESKTPPAKTESQQSESDLPWLNEFGPDKTTQTREWARLVAKKEAGEPIEIKELRKHYKVSKTIETKINELINS